MTHAGQAPCNAQTPGGLPSLERAQNTSEGVGLPAHGQNNGQDHRQKDNKHMTVRTADRAAAARGAGSVRERLKPASARDGGFAGESTRGVLPSRPPAAPAWTGHGEGGGRAQGRPGLLRPLRVRRRRGPLSVCAGCMGDIPIHTRCGRVWVRARAGNGLDSGQDVATGAGCRGRAAALARGNGVQPVSVGGRLYERRVYDRREGRWFRWERRWDWPVSRRCALQRLRRGRGPLSMLRALPGAWRLRLRAGRRLGTGTGRRCLGV